MRPGRRSGVAFALCGGLVVGGCGGGSAVTGPRVAQPLVISLHSQGIAYDSLRQRVYVATSASDPTHPNSVVALDPVSGSVVGSVVVGSDPALPRISDDDQYLYLGLLSGPTVVRINLPALTVDQQIPLDRLPANDLAVMPGHPHTFAVSQRGLPGVAIYDDGFKRPEFLVTGPEWLVFADSVHLYGSDGATLYRMTIDPYGVSLSGSSPGFDAGQGPLWWDRGRIFASSGVVVDPTSGQAVGTVHAGWVAPDGGRNRVYVLIPAGTSAAVYNESLALIGEDALPGIGDGLGYLTCLGGSALTWATATNQVVILPLQ